MTSLDNTHPLSYSALEGIYPRRPVDRLSYMESKSRGKFVFDLGALDETAYQSKLDQNNWLHARLFKHASKVVGIDNSSLVPLEGIQTHSNAIIVNRDIFDLANVVREFGAPDIIVAGELIEHLLNPITFISQIKRVPELSGTELLISTPNACNWHNWLLGLIGRESMHRDHINIYSYKTLRTLFRSCGIELQELTPYHVRFPEMIQNTFGIKKIAVMGTEKIINIAERVAPALSGGWIAHAKLKHS